MELNLNQYEINTYVNDHNIIDKPLVREENGELRFFGYALATMSLYLILSALLTIRGAHLGSNISMPFTKYRPEFSEVSFSVEAPNPVVSLTLPAWNTYNLHPTPDRTQLGKIGRLRVDGSYL